MQIGKWTSKTVSKTRLIETLANSQTFPQFSLVGRFNEYDRRFVQHVALLAGEVTVKGSVPVLHMGPPLRSDIGSPEQFIPQIAAPVALDEPQKTKLLRWANRIATEEGPKNKDRYIIKPHVKQERSEKAVVLYHRFSCAGYAHEGLRRAGVNLCLVNDLPEVGERELSVVYPRLPLIMRYPRQRKHFGIEDDPDWKILLPAYLFHAVDSATFPFRVPDKRFRTYPIL